ncbi:hypothetical protein MMMB2_2596 [Mycobacterium marinum MB2]|nr:hypothetical protein MMMB2_2596 [Mycobacterium marinum MB2]
MLAVAKHNPDLGVDHGIAGPPGAGLHLNEFACRVSSSVDPSAP